MVLYFNIQVDNPIAILNQDTARTFLVSNNPKDKYLLLMRATQLHYIKTLYEEIEQDINTTQMIISQKNKVSYFKILLYFSKFKKSYIYIIFFFFSPLR